MNSFQDFLASEVPQEDKQDIFDLIFSLHIVEGEYGAADLQDGATLKTLLGEFEGVMYDLKVQRDGSDIRIFSPVSNSLARVIMQDIQASNGVIHVLNDIILPE